VAKRGERLERPEGCGNAVWAVMQPVERERKRERETCDAARRERKRESDLDAPVDKDANAVWAVMQRPPSFRPAGH